MYGAKLRKRLETAKEKGRKIGEPKDFFVGLRHKVTVKTDGVSMLGAHMYVRLARVIEINHVVIGVLIRLHVNLYARLVFLWLRCPYAFGFCHEVQSLRG